MVIFLLALGMICAMTMIVVTVSLVQDFHVFKFVAFARYESEASKREQKSSKFHRAHP